MAQEIENGDSSLLSRIPWKKSLVLFFIGLGLLFLYVAFANFTQVIQILSATDPTLFGLAVFSIILGSLFYTIAWQKLLKLTGLPTSFLRTMYYTYIGLFFDLVISIGGTTGIAVRAYLLRDEHKTFKETDIWGRALTSQTAMKICVTTWVVITGVLSFIYLLLQFSLPRYTTITIFFFMVVSTMTIIVLIWVSVHPGAPTHLAHGILNIVERVFPFTKQRIENFRPKAEENARIFNKGMRVLIRQKKALLFSLTFSFLYYLSFIVAAWLSFVALGLQQPVLVVCAIATVALIIEFLGLGLPGGLGVKEIVTAELFVAVIGGSSLNLSGIAPKAAAAAASIMVNILMFWVPLVLSSLFAFKAIPLLRKAMQSMDEMAKQDPSPPPADDPGQISTEVDGFP